MSLRLKNLYDWMHDQDLLDASAQERVQRLQEQLRSDKVMVAFVAEFSRGKSELINAVFFAGYGRRIMPASAGRTTMCPTELGYDAAVPPCLRLLPIETRLQPQALLEWRNVPEKWTRVDLDVNDPAQLAEAMEKVSETLHVNIEEARSLGFWHDDAPDDNPPQTPEGLVEVPRWRHALINMAHPLLKQGLVVLDTPGLNAIGAEPELTVNLIPQAQAVVFILAADTGVTKSDLSIWREHLSALDSGDSARFVVLNKIDTLWDDLNTAVQIDAQIQRQCVQTAQTLELPAEQVIALSAQKGLLAKVRGESDLLSKSRLPVFEELMASQVLGARQVMLISAIDHAVDGMRGDAMRTLGVRRRELSEQDLELNSLRGKNQGVIRQMRLRIDAEKEEFDRSGASILAVRSVHMKLLRDVFRLLGKSSIKTALADLVEQLRDSGMKLGVRKTYSAGFDNLRGTVRQVQKMQAEIEEMLKASFRQLNTDFGFSLQMIPPPDMTRFISDLNAVERSHLQYLGLSNSLQLARPEFAEKLVRALLARVRAIFETALGEVELWSKTSSSQIDTQLKERQRAFTRRVDAIERIQEAASSLDQRIAEIHMQSDTLNNVQKRMDNLIGILREFKESAPRAAAVVVQHTATAAAEPPAPPPAPSPASPPAPPAPTLVPPTPAPAPILVAPEAAPAPAASA
ncbi:MAG: dynamin family protein [Burkholderiaceae bacterium]|jgi:hypothetical protein|nr:dynamin family protein [Burkholderiaceae bacterium]